MYAQEKPKYSALQAWRSRHIRGQDQSAPILNAVFMMVESSLLATIAKDEYFSALYMGVLYIVNGQHQLDFSTLQYWLRESTRSRRCSTNNG